MKNGGVIILKRETGYDIVHIFVWSCWVQLVQIFFSFVYPRKVVIINAKNGAFLSLSKTSNLTRDVMSSSLLNGCSIWWLPLLPFRTTIEIWFPTWLDSVLKVLGGHKPKFKFLFTPAIFTTRQMDSIPNWPDLTFSWPEQSLKLAAAQQPQSKLTFHNSHCCGLTLFFKEPRGALNLFQWLCQKHQKLQQVCHFL